MSAEANPEVAMVQRVLDKGMEGYTPDRIGLILRTVAPPGTTPDELALFLSFCEARDLNPLMKQVYLMKDKAGRVSIVTGIDGLRLLAQRSGEYEGQVGPEWRATADSPWEDVPPEDNLYACRVGVWRTGFRTPIWATVRFTEFVKTESWAVNWRDRPSHMIAIRAESHALRKAFPAETAGVTVHYEGGVQVAPTFSGDPDAPVTYPQQGLLHKLAKKHQWTRPERLDEASERLGRVVPSFSNLTRGEAHRLIDEWTNELDELEDVAAGDPDPSESESPSPPSEPPAAPPVQGKGGRRSMGKGESASRPADTSERVPAEVLPGGEPVGASGVAELDAQEPDSDPTVAERTTRSGADTPPSDNAVSGGTSGAAPSATSHRFVGTGLLCEAPGCGAAEEHPDHREAK